MFDTGDLLNMNINSSSIQNCVIKNSNNGAIALMAGEGGSIKAALSNNVAFAGFDSLFKIYSNGVSLTNNLGIITKTSFEITPQKSPNGYAVAIFENKVLIG